MEEGKNMAGREEAEGEKQMQAKEVQGVEGEKEVASSKKVSIGMQVGNNGQLNDWFITWILNVKFGKKKWSLASVVQSHLEGETSGQRRSFMDPLSDESDVEADVESQVSVCESQPEKLCLRCLYF